MDQKLIYALWCISVLLISSMNAQMVSGTVTDETGIPLPGVNMVEKGTSNGAAPDFDGKYSIGVGPNSILITSAESYFLQAEAIVRGIGSGDAQGPDVEGTKLWFAK